MIPNELSLVLRPEPNDENRLRFLPEMGVTLWANTTLQPGDTFYPDDGRVRLEKLEIYTLLKVKDVSSLSYIIKQLLVLLSESKYIGLSMVGPSCMSPHRSLISIIVSLLLWG